MWWNFRNNVGMGEVNIERHPLEGLGMREVEVSASLALRSGFFSFTQLSWLLGLYDSWGTSREEKETDVTELFYSLPT